MRLTPLRADDLVGEQRDLYDSLVAKSMKRTEQPLNERGEARGPVAVSLHHPASGRPLQELAGVLRFGGTLSDLQRETVILVVASHWQDEHELAAHEPLARAAGMSEEQLATLERGEQVSFADPVVQAVFDAAHAMVQRSDLTDDEFAKAHAVLNDEQLVEITVLIGYYAMVSLQLRVFRVPGRTRAR